MPSGLFDMRTLILKVLSKSPKHGYQLCKELSELLGKEPSLGGMYPILKDLESKGWIRGHEMVEYGRFKKIYKITDLGKKELDRVDRKYKVFKKFMEG